MLIKELKNCAEILSADGCLLRQLLHPGKAPLELRYSLSHAALKPGQTSKPHRLKTSEVYYIIEGAGLMRIDGEMRDVGPGAAIYIPPGAVQNISNTGNSDLVFICIVDPAWREEDEEVL